MRRSLFDAATRQFKGWQPLLGVSDPTSVTGWPAERGLGRASFDEQLMFGFRKS